MGEGDVSYLVCQAAMSGWWVGCKHVLAGLDLDVPTGTVLALLGPNGAGETTTVEILQGLRRRAAGSVSVLGEDPQNGSRSWRARIGVVSQSSKPVL